MHCNRSYRDHSLSAVLGSCLALCFIRDSDAFVGPPDRDTNQNEIALGALITSGNASTRSINGNVVLSGQKGSWRRQTRFEALRSSDDRGLTAERYLAAGKLDYEFAPRHYTFVTGQYEDDRFSGLDFRVSEAIGYGRRAIERPTTQLDLEIGVGARQNRFKTGEQTGEAMLYTALQHVWQPSKVTTFRENLTIESGEDAVITRSITALKMNIVGDLAMQLTLTVRNTSQAPPDTKRTDTETALTLIYNL